MLAGIERGRSTMVKVGGRADRGVTASSVSVANLALSRAVAASAGICISRSSRPTTTTFRLVCCRPTEQTSYWGVSVRYQRSHKLFCGALFASRHICGATRDASSGLFLRKCQPSHPNPSHMLAAEWMQTCDAQHIYSTSNLLLQYMRN